MGKRYSGICKRCDGPVGRDHPTAQYCTTCRWKRQIRTHCKNKHPLSGKNLRLSLNKRTGKMVRHCKTCEAVQTAKWRNDHPGYGRNYYWSKKQ